MLYNSHNFKSVSCFHTVRWFQVLLYNSHNLTSVICLQAVCSIRLIDRTLSGAIIPGQSGPGSNGNEGVLHILRITKAAASPSDGLMSFQDIRWGILPLCRDAVNVLYIPRFIIWVGTEILKFNPKQYSLKRSCKLNFRS